MKNDRGAILMIGMEKPQGGRREIPVPTHALAIEGTEPSEGDSVEFSVKATVKRVDGALTFVEPSEINGEPIGKPEENPEDMADDQMINKAKEADDEDMGSIGS